MENLLNKITCGNCVEVMKKIPDNSIDLTVTSPPYNVGIEYDSWNDELSLEEYNKFAKEWLSEVFRVLKDDGRIAVNILYELNTKDRYGRVFMASEYWQMMKEIGFKLGGTVDLKEAVPHRVKYTAWGSWLSPSAPYIYNAKECVIIAYKHTWKKKNSGESYFNDSNKSEFLDIIKGEWSYRAQTHQLTKANFSLDIPEKAIKILSYKDDIVLDPFMGSGTTALAAINLDRNYIGIEISDEYCKIARERVKYKQEKMF